MTKNDVINLSRINRSTNQTIFRTIIGKVKNLNLNLAIIQNDKRLKTLGETYMENLQEMEPARLKKLREDYKKSAEKTRGSEESDSQKEIREQLDREYNQFILSDEVRKWLTGESEIELVRETISRKYAEGFDTDQLETLLYFVDIEGSEPSTKPTKKK